MSLFTSRPVTAGGLTLCREGGTVVHIGDVLADFRGDAFVVKGGAPPRHAGSTGRIYVSVPGEDATREYYPTVFDCRWEEAA